MHKCIACRETKPNSCFTVRSWTASRIYHEHRNVTCKACCARNKIVRQSGAIPPPKPSKTCAWCLDKKGPMKFPRKYESSVCSACIDEELTDLPKVKHYHRRHKYKLSLLEFTALVTRANGLCEICRSPCDKLVVDHCHATNRVRGLLCPACNFVLGHYEKGWRPCIAIPAFDAWVIHHTASDA